MSDSSGTFTFLPVDMYVAVDMYVHVCDRQSSLNVHKVNSKGIAFHQIITHQNPHAILSDYSLQDAFQKLQSPTYVNHKAVQFGFQQ